MAVFLFIKAFFVAFCYIYPEVNDCFFIKFELSTLVKYTAQFIEMENVVNKYKSKLEAAFKQALKVNDDTKINHELLGLNNESISYLSLEEIIYLKLVVSLK